MTQRGKKSTAKKVSEEMEMNNQEGDTNDSNLGNNSSAKPEEKITSGITLPQGNKKSKLNKKLQIAMSWILHRAKPMTEEKLEVGQCYPIVKDYEQNDDGELTVAKGNRVKILNVEGGWVKVETCSNPSLTDGSCNQALGQIPIDCLVQGGGGIFSVAWMTLFIIVLYSVGTYGYKCYKSKSPDKTLGSFELFELKLNAVEEEFKEEPEVLWNTIHSCLNSVDKEDIPCVLLLLKQKDEGSRETALRLHRQIGSLASTVLNVGENDIITYKGSEMSSFGKDDFFDVCKSKLEKQKVMLISEMELMPSDILLNFHSLCDIYSPAVKNAAIIFLLNFETSAQDPDPNVASFAAEQINKIWGPHIHHDIIQPLTTRLTNNVVRISATK